MEKILDEVLKRLMKGEHVMGHKPGLWNDMFIETTYMLYGYGPNGSVGFTPNALKKLALSMHISRSHAIEMVFVFIATGHAGSSARSFMLSCFFFKTLGLRSGSISGH